MISTTFKTIEFIKDHAANFKITLVHNFKYVKDYPGCLFIRVYQSGNVKVILTLNSGHEEIQYYGNNWFSAYRKYSATKKIIARYSGYKINNQ